MMTENIIDGVDVSGLSCSECPENEKKRCLEQQEKYKSEIYYFLSFLENDFTKGQIEVLKTKISYPTRCDVVLEKKLKRKEAECEELQKIIDCKNGTIATLEEECEENREVLTHQADYIVQLSYDSDRVKWLEDDIKKLQAYISEDLKPHTQIYIKALEEIREIAKSVSCFTACDEKKLEKIQTKINEVMK